MDENTVRLLDLFGAYQPEEDIKKRLDDVRVFQAEIDMEYRRVSVTVQLQEYLPLEMVRRIEKGICRAYDIRVMELQPVYDRSLQAQMALEDVGRYLMEQYAPSISILVGCEYELQGDTLTLTLKGGGGDLLRPYLPGAERWLQSMFGAPIHLEIHSVELDPAELFAATERIRREAIEHMQRPEARQAVEKRKVAAPPSRLIYGKGVRGKTVPMQEIGLDSGVVVVEGEVFAVGHKELPKAKAWVVNFDVTDHHGAVRVSQYMENAKAKPVLEKISKGMWVRIQGKIVVDRFENDIVLKPYSIEARDKVERMDLAREKRVELHLHTRFSSMDALTEPGDAVKTAQRWGHKAIGFTDHGVAQAFPDAMKAAKNIKILYGCEGYFVNDVDAKLSVRGDQDQDFHGEYVVFDLETTGLSFTEDAITEIGAAIYRDGKMEQTFQTFVDPERRLSRKITDLTGITDDMLRGAPKLSEAIPAFLAFCGDRPLAAHNADFDVSFVKEACRKLGISFQPTYLDTLVMAQGLLPSLSKHKLNLVADALGLPAFNHHRAVDDAMTVGYMLERFFQMLEEKGVTRLSQINEALREKPSGGKLPNLPTRHIILYAKNNTGLRNLYRLISYGHLKYYKRVPRIPKSELIRWREGILIGSACEAGELFQAVVENKSWDELLRIASFYDFLEIQPLCNNRFMIAKGTARDEEDLRNFNRTIVRLGEELHIPVVATGDVHFLEPEDEIFRHILLSAKEYEDADKDLPIYFKTTDEMLEEFSYLGEEKCYDVVIRKYQSHRGYVRCDPAGAPQSVSPLHRELRGKAQRAGLWQDARALWGKSSVSHHRAHRNGAVGHPGPALRRDLYVRPDAGGQFSGTRLSGGQPWDPWDPPWWPSCRASRRSTPCRPTIAARAASIRILPRERATAAGRICPTAICPVCGEKYVKDGFDIPFETFLGFGGDKVPDIDLNFSGEYQAKAHAYRIEMFGSRPRVPGRNHRHRGGKDRLRLCAEIPGGTRDESASKAEENRLAMGCTGVKRTTGQHPGGLVVIPGDKEIYDFCPVQHPADDPNTRYYHHPF